MFINALLTVICSVTGRCNMLLLAKKKVVTLENNDPRLTFRMTTARKVITKPVSSTHCDFKILIATALAGNEDGTLKICRYLN